MAMRVREDYRTLTGAEKAAILLLALGEDQMGKLFTLMDDEEIKEISQTMANLGTVSSTIVERLFVDFAEQISATGSLVGTYESTERLLVKVLGAERVNAHHGRNPRPGRPHHVGQARQRERSPCSPTTSRTNIRRPSPSCCRRSSPTTPAAC